jgi:hypothetical protein
MVRRETAVPAVPAVPAGGDSSSTEPLMRRMNDHEWLVGEDLKAVGPFAKNGKIFYCWSRPTHVLQILSVLRLYILAPCSFTTSVNVISATSNLWLRS